ncbi:hypothetical protein D3C73_880240 [compost metagenome]
MDQSERDYLSRHRPGGGGIGELGQQRQEQQEDLGIEAAHADTLEGPVVPGPRALILVRRRHGGVQ